jgi:hypothetical protein
MGKISTADEIMNNLVALPGGEWWFAGQGGIWRAEQRDRQLWLTPVCLAVDNLAATARQILDNDSVTIISLSDDGTNSPRCEACQRYI